MKKIVLTVIFLIGIITVSAQPLIQYPAIFSDGETMAFTYNGDIYKIDIKTKDLKRITNNVDYDYRPIWSPDGEKIGFTSNRSGNYEVYTISKNGGHPRRLTYNSNFDGLYSWPEKNILLVGSYRNFKGKRTYSIDSNGKNLRKILDYEMFKAKKRKNKYLFYGDGISINRKNYKGSAARNILIYDEKKEKLSYEVKSNDMDIYPVWGENDNTIYYISNKSGNPNIWKKNINSGTVKQITDYKDKKIQWLYSSPNGKYLSYIADFIPYVYDTETNNTQKIDFKIENDYHYTNKKLKKIGYSGFKEAEISKNGKNILFVCEGDILKNDTDKENNDTVYPQNLTDSPSWERDVVWSPNNQIFAYVSTSGGNFDIYIQDINGKHRKKITNTDEIENLLSFSPKGKYLAYSRFPGKLIVHSMKNHTEKEILDMPYLYDISWGPEGKYLVVSRSDENYNQDIFIVSSDGNFKRNISLSSGDCFNPHWNNKGDAIYWVESKFGRYFIKKLNINPEDENGVSIKKDDEFIVETKQEEIYSTEKNIKDFRIIEKDENLVIALRSEEFNGIVKYNQKKEKDEKIVQNQKVDTIRVNDENERIYYLSGDNLFSVRYSGRDTESYSAASFKHFNKKSHIKELYKQTWILLSEWFYDSTLHNKNLSQLKNFYDKYLEDIILKRDLYTIIDEVFGELNASHLGIWGEREKSHNTRFETGYFGATLDSNLKIDYILELSEISKKVEQNDKLLAVNGEKIETLTEFDKKMTGKRGREVELLFKQAGKIKTELKSRNYFYNEYLKEQDINNKRIVDKKSQGKIAYIHLRRMHNENLKKFKEEIASYARDKKGLIIDVRNNSGGNIAKHILGILERDVYAYSKRRYLDDLTEEPSGYSWNKPVVVLINENSFSNAEIFPAGFKALDLGKVIGVPTAGGVIGTYNTELMDGTTFRLPHVKWLTKDMKNMENLGIEPDIYIENHPGEILKNKDSQLQKAIEVLKKEIN